MLIIGFLMSLNGETCIAKAVFVFGISIDELI